tara:strand:- start:4927 stop:5766 length:840 start_codon:yes stop_codon:yes gene_type:complete
MKKEIVFIADFFVNDINGGGESNDNNLINHLRKNNNVQCFRSNNISIENLIKSDVVIVGNFVGLPEEIKSFLIKNKKYIIYEHDHKYVNTRDPSKFYNFEIPKKNIINKNFYEEAHTVVVLSKICKETLNKNIPKANVHSIGCSLWTKQRLELLLKLSEIEKIKSLCILNSSNPTKNTASTVKYCNDNNLSYEAIHNPSPSEFVKQMSQFEKFLFIPTVLETFSRVCAEAKMMNLQVMTNKKLVGFFSEDISNLSGKQLINEIFKRNANALSFFDEVIK